MRLQIIRQRIWRHQSHDGLVWNSEPGALLTVKPGFSDNLADFPFSYGAIEAHKGCEDGPYSSPRRNVSSRKFTAVIYTQLASASPAVHLSAPIFKLARNVAASSFVDSVSALHAGH